MSCSIGTLRKYGWFISSGSCQAEAGRAGDDVLHRLQLGHVALRLGRHAQALVVGRQAGALVLGDRALHAAFAPVVGGERELPVAEHAVELLQVVERGAGRGEDVAAVVAKDVLLELEVAPGRRDELPHAGGARHRHRLRVVGALDERQQRQLGRHAALVELLDDVEEVAAAALGHARDVVGPRRVPALAVAHQVAVEVGHREAAAHAIPEVDAGGAVVEVEADVGAQRVDRHRRGDDLLVGCDAAAATRRGGARRTGPDRSRPAPAPRRRPAPRAPGRGRQAAPRRTRREEESAARASGGFGRPMRAAYRVVSSSEIVLPGSQCRQDFAAALARRAVRARGGDHRGLGAAKEGIDAALAADRRRHGRLRRRAAPGSVLGSERCPRWPVRPLARSAGWKACTRGRSRRASHRATAPACRASCTSAPRCLRRACRSRPKTSYRRRRRSARRRRRG